MAIKDILQVVYYSLSTAGVLCIVIKLLYGWVRSDQLNKRFVDDMAEIHIPYIYNTLTQIAAKLGIEVSTAPSISFVRFKDK